MADAYAIVPLSPRRVRACTMSAVCGEPATYIAKYGYRRVRGGTQWVQKPICDAHARNFATRFGLTHTRPELAEPAPAEAAR